MIALNGTSQLQGGSRLDFSFSFFIPPFLFFERNVMLNLGAMRRVGGGGGVSPSSDNSRRKNRAVRSYLFSHARTHVCVCEWLQWVACFWCVYVRINPFPPLLFLCVPRSGMLQRRTQLWHNNVPHVEWPTYRGTQWVSRLTGLVVCCHVREWAYCKESRPRSSVCLCVSPQMLSCVLAAVCLPWVFEETCLLFWPSAF